MKAYSTNREFAIYQTGGTMQTKSLQIRKPSHDQTVVHDPRTQGARSRTHPVFAVPPHVVALARLRPSLYAVSYTHLDVYKRQELLKVRDER